MLESAANYFEKNISRIEKLENRFNKILSFSVELTMYIFVGRYPLTDDICSNTFPWIPYSSYSLLEKRVWQISDQRYNYVNPLGRKNYTWAYCVNDRYPFGVNLYRKKELLSGSWIEYTGEKFSSLRILDLKFEQIFPLTASNC